MNNEPWGVSTWVFDSSCLMFSYNPLSLFFLLQENVVVDGNVITGQNPSSGLAVGKAILAALQKP